MNVTLPPSLHSTDAKILDAGGWFIPFNQATHVVDLMPYETRGSVLHLDPLPGERFSKATWHQINFLQPALKLPFPDKFFDFSVCGHTVEDLTDPQSLLSELRRVSKAGYIETPSRISEQTVGVRDRMTNAQGHPHHHWIVEVEDGQLLLSSKKASLAGPPQAHVVPLRTFEALKTRKPDAANTGYYWDTDLSWKILSDNEAALRSQLMVTSLHISPADIMLDSLVRKIRFIKRRLTKPAKRNTADRWQEILTLSRPYSTIPL